MKEDWISQCWRRERGWGIKRLSTCDDEIDVEQDDSDDLYQVLRPDRHVGRKQQEQPAESQSRERADVQVELRSLGEDRLWLQQYVGQERRLTGLDDLEHDQHQAGRDGEQGDAPEEDLSDDTARKKSLAHEGRWGNGTGTELTCAALLQTPEGSSREVESEASVEMEKRFLWAGRSV